MPNAFILRKYIEDKDHKPQEFANPNEAVLAERAFLADYPDALFVVQEVDGAGNLVPNRDIDPRTTLKKIEAEIRPALGDLMGAAKGILSTIGVDRENDDPYEADLGRVQKIAEEIRDKAERMNEVFKR